MFQSMIRPLMVFIVALAAWGGPAKFCQAQNALGYVQPTPLSPTLPRQQFSPSFAAGNRVRGGMVRPTPIPHVLYKLPRGHGDGQPRLSQATIPREQNSASSRGGHRPGLTGRPVVPAFPRNSRPSNSESHREWSSTVQLPRNPSNIPLRPRVPAVPERPKAGGNDDRRPAAPQSKPHIAKMDRLGNERPRINQG